MDYRNDIAYEAEPSVREDLHPLTDLMDYVRTYTRERPEVVALTCFGIGFILGWKLKPW
jgi:hypothetical protein